MRNHGAVPFFQSRFPEMVLCRSRQVLSGGEERGTFLLMFILLKIESIGIMKKCKRCIKFGK